MNRAALPLVLTLLLCPSVAQAGIHTDIHLPALPPLVEIRPGIQVVEDFPDEVFFHGGWYWCRRPEGWYRALHPRDRFDWIDARRVPPGLVHEPIGHYRYWRHESEGWHGSDHPRGWHKRRYEGHPPYGYGPGDHGPGPDGPGEGPHGPGGKPRHPLPPPPYHHP